jgi:beta-phosphoglucomutase-like phosphatase (HAD superfamily)
MIRNIIFDLDGVLFDGCDLHAQLFLQAVSQIRPDIQISKEYHDKYLNGLPTKEKLKLLGIEGEEAKDVYTIKQNLTGIHLSAIEPSEKNFKICAVLKELGYDIYCVSNSILSSIQTVLSRMGILNMFSGIISNEDVSESKPSPIPYLTLYSKFNIKPEESLILEDSEFGILSATQSGGFTLCVRNCDDVTISNILATIDKIKLNPSLKCLNLAI